MLDTLIAILEEALARAKAAPEGSVPAMHVMRAEQHAQLARAVLPPLPEHRDVTDLMGASVDTVEVRGFKDPEPG